MRKSTQPPFGVAETDKSQQLQRAFAHSVASHAPVNEERLANLPFDRVQGIERRHRLLKNHADFAAAPLEEVVFRCADHLEAVETDRFDAVILDVMLPDLDGFEVCRRIRERSAVPVVMLTARGEETDRIVGLEIGADDYLSKPFSPRELLARIRAVLRRTQAPDDTARPKDHLRFGRLEILRDSREVQLDGERCTLTSHQFALLCLLAENAGRVPSRDQIMQGLRGHSLEAFDRSIDVHVSRTRVCHTRV